MIKSLLSIANASNNEQQSKKRPRMKQTANDKHLSSEDQTSPPITEPDASISQDNLETQENSFSIADDLITLENLAALSFANVDDVKLALDRYAESRGFSIRNHTQRKDDVGNIRYRKFVCSHQGAPKPKKTDIGSQRSRASIRCNCQWHANTLRVLDDETNSYIWKLTICHDLHSHPIKESVDLARQRSVELSSLAKRFCDSVLRSGAFEEGMQYLQDGLLKFNNDQLVKTVEDIEFSNSDNESSNSQ